MRPWDPDCAGKSNESNSFFDQTERDRAENFPTQARTGLEWATDHSASGHSSPDCSAAQPIPLTGLTIFAYADPDYDDRVFDSPEVDDAEFVEPKNAAIDSSECKLSPGPAVSEFSSDQPYPVTGLTIIAYADPEFEAPELKGGKGKQKKRRAVPGVIGELGEAAFLHKALAMGLVVARPWGNSRRFDFLVQKKPKSREFYRVQVKCTQSLLTGGYQISASHLLRSGEHRRYSRHDIDFIAGYVIPSDVFYIVPIAACKSRDLRFYPEGSQRHREKYESFREKWELLGAKVKKKG